MTPFFLELLYLTCKILLSIAFVAPIPIHGAKTALWAIWREGWRQENLEHIFNKDGAVEEEVSKNEEVNWGKFRSGWWNLGWEGWLLPHSHQLLDWHLYPIITRQSGLHIPIRVKQHDELKTLPGPKMMACFSGANPVWIQKIGQEMANQERFGQECRVLDETKLHAYLRLLSLADVYLKRWINSQSVGGHFVSHHLWRHFLKGHQIWWEIWIGRQELADGRETSWQLLGQCRTSG